MTEEVKALHWGNTKPCVCDQDLYISYLDHSLYVELSVASNLLPRVQWRANDLVHSHLVERQDLKNRPVRPTGTRTILLCTDDKCVESMFNTGCR